MKFILIILFLFLLLVITVNSENNKLIIRSIDTVKMSRDLARVKLGDNDFDYIIDRQVKNIADTGANYVAIATPYDNEFSPFLKKWVKAARKYKLKVWFRGNWSGWEGWFGYPLISEEEHINKTGRYILDNKDLFENGDIFTSCTECENGNSMDPRKTGKVQNFRNFLIDEYIVNQDSFKIIDKEVFSNYFSMNRDVAKIVMDKETTKKLDGVVVVDHYTSTPEQLQNDIKEIADLSGGKVVLGEFGVPIIDINGEMTEEEQAKWINESFDLLSNTPDLIGVNYWTSTDASTGLWNNDGTPRMAVNMIKKYFLD